MAKSETNTHNRGTVKDPEHGGRLKENREAGRTKGTTEASAARQDHGHAEPTHESKGQPAKASSDKSSQESDDLKSREYTDKDGNVHHHTRTHGGS